MSLLRSKIHAALLRAVPSLRPWRLVGDHVTFAPHGFVAAEDPHTLLARHNYETHEIRRLLAGPYLRSLEIGCGFGRLSPHFAELSASHLAMDINLGALVKASTHYPGFGYLGGSATDMPFPDESFDLVTTWTVLQHIRPGRIDKAMQEIHRVARRTASVLLCEESSSANAHQRDRWHTHTWHRAPSFYSDRLPGFSIVAQRSIEEMEVVGIPTPGTVLLLQRWPPLPAQE